MAEDPPAEKAVTSKNDESKTWRAKYLSSQLLWEMYFCALEFTKSVRQAIWPDDDPVAEAEDRFLRCLKDVYYRYYTEISDKCLIWTLSSKPYTLSKCRSISNDEPAIVVLHGFVAGLAFWAMNLDSLNQLGLDLYAIDLPGYARSSRVEFCEEALDTEKVFVEIIDSWRRCHHINKMILIGHSMGGYISCAYALAYPEHVSRLILVDPWGFPDLREEVTSVVESSPTSAITSSLLTVPVWLRIIIMILMPFSPFSFIRISGRYFGPKIIHRLRPDMTRRYASIFGDDDCTTVSDYIYHTNKFKPTGEYAFRSLSHPLAWAKLPMIKRISHIDKNIPISFIYGSRSWIDYQTGFLVKKILIDSVVTVHVIEGAGHHLFADEPARFNTLVAHIIRGDFQPQSHMEGNSDKGDHHHHLLNIDSSFGDVSVD